MGHLPNHLYVRRKHLLMDTLHGYRDEAVKANQALVSEFHWGVGCGHGRTYKGTVFPCSPMFRDNGIFSGCHERMLPAKKSSGIANGAIKNMWKKCWVQQYCMGGRG